MRTRYFYGYNIVGASFIIQAMSIGAMLMSRLQAPWQLFLLYGVLAGIGLSTHDVITLSTVARWFVKRRGMITGIVKVGTGIGQFLVPAFAAAIIAVSGWQRIPHSRCVDPGDTRGRSPGTASGSA